MILTPVFAPDAKSQWLELDIDLQEALLDEMENLAAHPPSSIRILHNHDFVITRGSERHYVFFQFVLDWKAQRLNVTGVQHFFGSVRIKSHTIPIWIHD